MVQSRQIILTSIAQAFQELRANKLRSFLSLLGITIGIFCIIAVLTVVDSLEQNIKSSMESLGNDVLYVNKQPWVPEEAEYKWWEYLSRKPMGEQELGAIERNVQGVRYATICYADGVTIKHNAQEATGIVSYAVSRNFDKIQTVDIEEGRYMSGAEIDGGVNVCVIGDEVKNTLFIGNVSPVGKMVAFHGRKFLVVGTLKKSGQNMAGFNFDEGVIYPYQAAKALVNLNAIDWGTDPLIMVKAEPGINLQDVQYEIEGVLRGVRHVKPGEKKNFAINQLSQITEKLDILFGTINIVGWVIAGFSLLVGGFGIANIMFVTVKERTKIIGLKKAIGAKPASILLEFLIEAITLCLIGGLVGVIIVLLLSVGLTYGLDFAITLSAKNFFIGIGISGLVGVLAGFIPAWSASRLNPVVAIRSH